MMLSDIKKMYFYCKKLKKKSPILIIFSMYEQRHAFLCEKILSSLTGATHRGKHAQCYEATCIVVTIPHTHIIVVLNVFAN